MIYLQFLAGLVLYLTMASSSYSETFKQSNWYFPVGVGAAILANLLWFSIAKADSNSSSLMIKGLFWDTMLMACYLIIPVLFYEAKFTTVQAVGVGLTIVGLFMTKL